MLTKAAFIWSKMWNTNLKELFSVLIFYKMEFIHVMAKLILAAIVPVFDITWSLRNHLK